MLTTYIACKRRHTGCKQSLGFNIMADNEIAEFRFPKLICKYERLYLFKVENDSEIFLLS